MLGPATNIVMMDILRFHQLFEGVHHLIDITVTVKTLFSQQPGNGFVVIFMQIAKCQVFKLPLDLPDTQPMSQWRIDIRDFSCHLQALLKRCILDLAQCTGTFGDLDQRHPNVIDHINQHLPQIFLLVMLVHVVMWHVRLTDGSHLQNTIDQPCHFRTKALLNRFQADQVFTHRAIQDRSFQRCLIQL